ncbi:MAG: hypothetical protein ACLU37_13225, partial [Collinsella sp.]
TCLGTEDNARLRLRKLVAEIRPELVVRAARILIKAGRCDTAMDLADAFLDRSAVLELAGQYGVDLALTGHGGDVCRAALGKTEADGQTSEPTPDEALGIYLAAVSVSNTKLARYMASIIEHAGEQAICELDPCRGRWRTHLRPPVMEIVVWGFRQAMQRWKVRRLVPHSTCCPHMSR